MQDNEAFLHFLAGYADGEGIFHIGRCSGRNISFIFAVSSEDKEILTSLLHGLESMGFHPTLRMLRAKGETNVLYGQVLTYGDDQFMLRLKRKSEVIRLLEILPIRHHEKIRKRDLMLSLRDKIHIEDVSELWIDLKNQIKNEVKIYVSKAESEFHLRRNSLIISSALE
jgi:intein-encoded DNA endonuclease-like protein